MVENKYMNAVYNWLSPELLTGQAATEKSDLYSFCVVIWELINRAFTNIHLKFKSVGLILQQAGGVD